MVGMSDYSDTERLGVHLAGVAFAGTRKQTATNHRISVPSPRRNHPMRAHVPDLSTSGDTCRGPDMPPVSKAQGEQGKEAEAEILSA